MSDAAYLHAIAALLHDPLLKDSRHWIPQAWQVESADLIELSSQLAAGVPGAKPAAGTGWVRSILNSITADGKRAKSSVHWPVARLSFKETAPFPEEKEGTPDFSDHLNALEDAARVLKRVFEGASNASLPQYVESLMLLIEQYAWCLPSGYLNQLPDASLYDHSRMTAALAAIFAMQPPSDELKENVSRSDLPVALLVGGDISGIQEFIYQISSRGATPALRGRSFYLQLLSDIVPRFILNELDLPITNLIYAGGGHFFLLVPPGAKDKLRDLQGLISRVLLYHHRGDLYLALAMLPLTGKDFFGSGIAARWKELRAELQVAKQRRFSELGNEIDVLFEPKDHGGNQEKQCQVCGLEHPTTKPYDQTPENPDGVRKCDLCISFENDLGDKLRHANWLVYKRIEPTDAPDLSAEWVPGKWNKVLTHFGFQIGIHSSKPDVEGLATLFALTDEVDNVQPSMNVAVGRRFLVNVTPLLTNTDIQDMEDKLSEEEWKQLKVDQIKRYGVLEKQSEGITRLGVLRMDVDNMGDMFTAGLGEKASLARLASLSFAVHLFFDGWVGDLAKKMNEDDKRGGRLYSIYSGGDDLFFVGSWDAVVDLAVKIRGDLARYTGGHPGVHASAGVVLVGGKYPLSQAARDAGRAEDAAKDLQWFDHDRRPQRKDAITFLGQTLPWARFGYGDDISQTVVLGLMKQLKMLVDEKDANKHLLRLLVDLQLQYDDALQKKREAGQEYNQSGDRVFPWGPWMWRGEYYLSRMQNQTGDAQLQEEIKNLRKELKTNFHNVEWIGLAARWAELQSR